MPAMLVGHVVGERLATGRWSLWLGAALVVAICWLPCMGCRRWRRR
ncbi:MAG: hypothetical protein IT455_16180 [Planctomycetes bacterium]|nr:hypothetical protein [Planctomycetota bacterium]